MQDEILKQWEARTPEERDRLEAQLKVLDKQYAPGLKVRACDRLLM